MKKYVIIFLIIVVALSISSFYYYDEADQNSKKAVIIIQFIANLAAVGGLLGIFYQFKKDKDLNAASFIIQLNKDFHENKEIMEIYRKLEFCKKPKQEIKFEDEDIIKLASYLSFFDPFYNLIKKDIIKIGYIDEVFAYRFFLITNNRSVQKMILCRKDKVDAWLEIYKLYGVWKSHRKDRTIYLDNGAKDLTENKVYKNAMEL